MVIRVAPVAGLVLVPATRPSEAALVPDVLHGPVTIPLLSHGEAVVTALARLDVVRRADLHAGVAVVGSTPRRASEMEEVREIALSRPPWVKVAEAARPSLRLVIGLSLD